MIDYTLVSEDLMLQRVKLMSGPYTLAHTNIINIVFPYTLAHTKLINIVFHHHCTGNSNFNQTFKTVEQFVFILGKRFIYICNDEQI